MRQSIIAITLAAALVAAAPVRAQRASLADRVAALEQQAANNQGNVDLLNQVTALKSEVASLRAQLEELQHQNEQFRQSSRSQYLDLDGRLNRLEGGAAPAGPASATPTPSSAPASTGAGEAKPAVYGDAGTLAKGSDERTAYEAAFDTLKAGRYAESARQFQDFLQRFPSGAYAPNALYWLGESYYVTQNYALAQQQFQALLDRYPTHDKAAGALLKVGLSQYGLKQLDAAQATLAQVVQRYPGTDAARTADDRLRAIQLQAVQ
ncbi:MAG: tol-pal system protein YbgF [Luteimonas sp.]